MAALAIVIPVYKPTFLRSALESVAAQTDRRFRVYVGDDGGPPEIARTVSEFSSDLDLVYERYDRNLGGHALVAHWNRCVALTTEPWVWLFADDDLMSPDCVASFYSERELGGTGNLLRFDTDVIDAHGDVVRANPPHPKTETGVDFVFARLSGTRHSYVVEHVFRREAFERAGGFPDYPAAWCADDAAWFLFSQDGGIRTLTGGRISWRASGRNISTSPTAHRADKLTAAGEFLRFVEREVIPSDTRPQRTRGDWATACERWYLEQLRYPVPVGPSLWPEALRTSRSVWRASTLRKLATLSLWTATARRKALFVA